MKYFLISNYELVNHRPEINQINLFQYKNSEIWSCALNEIDPYIIKTYDFNQYIFYITHDEIDFILPFFEDNKKKKIIIKNCTCLNEKKSILYKLKTDIDLSVKVYFLSR